MMMRNALISTCAILCIATPALPQTTSNRAPTANSQPNYLTPPNMRAALRAWGLTRQTSTLRFIKRSTTADRAEFDTIVSTDAAGTATTLENLVITRSSLPGPTFGQFTIEARKLVTSRGDQVGTLSIVGLRGGDTLTPILSLVDNMRTSSASTDRPSIMSRATADSMTLTNIITADTNDVGTEQMTVSEISFTRPIFDAGLSSFEGLSLKNFAFSTASSDVKIASFQLTEAGSMVGRMLSRSLSGDQGPPDIAALAFGSLNLSNASITFKQRGTKSIPVNLFSLNSLRINGVRQGFVDLFEFAGLTAEGGRQAQGWKFGLGQLAMGGINTNYVAEVGYYIGALFQSSRPPSASNAAVTPNKPRRVFKDILPGGPLDGGFARFDLSDLQVSGGGLRFDLDTIGLRQQRNEAGIITKLDFVPTQMRLSSSAASGGGPNPLSSLFSTLGQDDFVMRFSAASSFSPATDIVTLDSYKVELEQWGKVDMRFAISGLTAFMANTSFSDFTDMAAAASRPPSSPGRAQLTALTAVYKDLKLVSGQMDVTDLGGLNKAARMETASRPRNQSQTAAGLTQAQVQETRLKWAEQPRTASGDKTKPALERMFGIAVARWIENGGTMRFTMNPPQPLGIAELEAGRNMSAQQLGLRITNQPPPASVR